MHTRDSRKPASCCLRHRRRKSQTAARSSHSTLPDMMRARQCCQATKPIQANEKQLQGDKIKTKYEHKSKEEATMVISTVHSVFFLASQQTTAPIPKVSVA